MMPANAYDSYLESEVLSANPLKLVELLYRGALLSIGSARRFLYDGDVEGRAHSIGKAGAIITELALSLDREKGGGLAANLAELYDYIQRLLVDANFRQSDAPLAEVEQLLNILYEGWQECSRESASAPALAQEIWTSDAGGREALNALY